MSRKTDRRPFAGLLALGTLLLAAYHVFLLPDIPADGDAAKLQAVAEVLGTPHPSGYPTWVLSAHLLGWILPWGSAAYAANLVTALFSIGGTCYFFLALLELQTSRVAAFAGSLALGLSPTLFSQSILAEVYSLNYFFLAAVTFCLLRWKNQLEQNQLDGGSAELRYLSLGLALYVLSFTNHLTTACLGPGILIFVLLVKPRAIKSFRLLGVVLASGALALFFYGYILWRSRSPEVLFLETQAADWKSLLGQLAGDPKRRHFFETDLGVVLRDRLPALLGRLWNEFYWLLPAALLGFRKASAPVHTLLGLFALGNLVFALSFTVPDKFVYFIPVYFVVGMYLGLGLETVLQRFPKASWLPAGMVLAALSTAFLGLPRVKAQQDFLVREASRLDELFDRLGEEPAVILADRYGTSMGLLHRSLLERPQLRVHHLPPVSYEIPLALAPLRRYLEEDLPLRSANYPKAFAAGHPVYCACVDPRRFEPHGIQAESLGQGLYRLRARLPTPASIPQARLVYRLDTVRDMVSAIELLRGDPQRPQASLRRSVFLGPRQQVEEQPPDPRSNVEVLSADDQSMMFSVQTSHPAWLVLTEPLTARWRVTVNGDRAERLDLDLLFSGVEVPAGRSQVIFSTSGNS